MLGRKRASPTKLQQRVGSLSSGVLKDEIQRYVNSAGVATRHYEMTGDSQALEVVIENAETLGVLAGELLQRCKTEGAFYPTTDPHLEELIEKFFSKKVRANG